MTETAAIVLAAGTASRFRQAGGAETTKLVARLEGTALVRHVVEAVLASRARPIIVVTGHARDEVVAALETLDVIFVHNGNYTAGIASSLQAGIAALPASAAGAVVLLADMPRVSGTLIDRLIAGFVARPDAAAVVPVLSGKRGNPVLIARRLFADIAGLSGDRGARSLIEADGKVVEITVGDQAVAIDVDTPEVLDALRQHGVHEPYR